VRRTKLSRLGVSAALVVAFTMMFPSVAFATATQDGYFLSGPRGVSGLLKMNSASPSSGHCLITSVLATNLAPTRHIEFGVLTCNGTTIDSTCGPSMTLFVEVFASPNYTCYVHGAASLGSQYAVNIHETAAGSNTFQAFSSGGTGFQWVSGLSGTSRTFAWLEGPGACDATWSGSANFQSLTRMDWSGTTPVWSGWSSPAATGLCDTKTAFDSSTGSFSVSHP
jgi:hypothetical protein